MIAGRWMGTLLQPARRLAFALVLVAMFGGSAPRAASMTIAVEDADNRPYEYLNEIGVLTGFHIEVIRAVCARIDLTPVFISVPWVRAQAMLEEGGVDAVSFIRDTPERRRYAIFQPGNVLHNQVVALVITRDRATQIAYRSPLESMAREWRFGATQGYAYPDEVEALLRSPVPVDEVARNQADLLEMLVAGRFDVAITAMDAFEQVRHAIPDIDRKVMRLQGVAFAGAPVYLAFGRHDPARGEAEAFAAAYADLRRSDDYAALVKRYGVEEFVSGIP